MDNLHEKGSILKKVREAKGITLEVIHEHTKIPLDALRALEEGYTIRTLSPFYQRGFLKIYAQYLECDLKEILGDFKPKEISSNSFLSSGAPSKNISSNPIFSKQDVPRLKLQDILTRERLILLTRILGVVFAVFIFFKMAGCVANKFSAKGKKPVVIKENKSSSSIKSKKEKPAKENHWIPPRVEEKVPDLHPPIVADPNPPAESLPAAASAAGPDVPAESHKNVSLSVRPKKNSWLQIKSDGAVVFAGTLKKGVTETWSGDQEIELSGKNISELEFEVNGKMIGILSRDERRAKKVIVTKNGLSVKK